VVAAVGKLPAWGGKFFIANPIVYLTPIIFWLVVWVLHSHGTRAAPARPCGENHRPPMQAGIPVLALSLPMLLARTRADGSGGGLHSV